MDWICLLLDANFTVIVMMPEAKRLLMNLYKLVKSQISVYSELNKIETFYKALLCELLLHPGKNGVLFATISVSRETCHYLPDLGLLPKPSPHKAKCYLDIYTDHSTATEMEVFNLLNSIQTASPLHGTGIYPVTQTRFLSITLNSFHSPT
ncbi:hypothetical protein H8959_000465 [Pygathrix nigripes]